MSACSASFNDPIERFSIIVGGALKDAKVDLSIICQVSAVLMLLATWSLFAIKIKKDALLRITSLDTIISL